MNLPWRALILAALFCGAPRPVTGQTVGAATSWMAGGRADSAHASRLAKIAEIWGVGRYFHPSGDSLRDQWDRGAIEAIRRLQANGSLDGAVADLLRVLNDPATRLQGDETERAQGPSGPPVLVDTTGGVLLVTITDYDAISRDLSGAINRLDEIAAGPALSAPGVVLDLRRRHASANPGYLRYLLANTRLLRLFALTPVPIPSVQRVQRIGLVPESNDPGIYSTERVVSSGGVLQPAEQSSAAPFVVLVNGGTEISPLLLALQGAGRAILVADGGIGADVGAEVYPVDLGGSTALVRISELVDSRGPVHPSAEVSVPHLDGPSDRALAVARGIALRPVPHRAAQHDGLIRAEVPRAAMPPRDTTAFPSAAERVFALVRVWNAVRYFYPHPGQMHRDGDQAFARALPEFESATDSLKYARAVAHLMANLGDTHAFTWGPTLGNYLGAAPTAVQVRMIEGHPTVTAFADSAAAVGIDLGDEVVAVDGVPTEQRLTSILEHVSASRPETAQRDAMLFLLNGPDSSRAELTVRGRNGVRTVRILRSRAYWAVGDGATHGEIARRLPDGLGYLDLTRLTLQAMPQALEQLSETRGLVLDLRGYQQGTDRQLMRWLASGEPRVYALNEKPLVRSPWPTAGGTVLTRQYLLPSAGEHYSGRVVVLVDERTQSASEHLALQLRAAGAILVGTPTAGADGNVTNLTLPGGLRVQFTGSSIRTPEGAPVQGAGVAPEVMARPTVQGIREGKDEVLDAAVAVLRRTVDSAVR